MADRPALDDEDGTRVDVSEPARDDASQAPSETSRPRVRGLNPLLVKELRARMRGARSFVVLTVYLLLLSIFGSLVYGVFLFDAGSGRGTATAFAQAGRVLFYAVGGLEILLICFLTPAFTSGAISGERERQTYDVLRTTLLSSWQIAAGKLSSALIFLVLLTLASVPLRSLAFMLGGVVLGELIISEVILLLTALFVGTLGLFFSCLVSKTLVATVLSYGATLLTTVVAGPSLLLVLVLFMDVVPYGVELSAAAAEAFEIITSVVAWLLLGLSPLTAAGGTVAMALEEDTFWFAVLPVGLSGVELPAPSPWILFVITYGLGSVVLLLLSVLLLSRRAKR